MSGRHRVRCLIVAVALFALTACSIASKTPLPAGTVAPDFELEVGDQTLTLANYRGRVTVIAFWASP